MLRPLPGNREGFGQLVLEVPSHDAGMCMRGDIPRHDRGASKYLRDFLPPYFTHHGILVKAGTTLDKAIGAGSP